MKKLTSNYSRWKAGVVLFLVILAAQVLVVLPRANAATLTMTMVRLDRLAKSTATTGTVCASTGTSATEGNVVLTFPAGFTVGASANWTTSVTTTGWPTGASAWPSIQAQGTASGQTVTFTSGDLSTATTYCFNWDSTAALTTPSSTGSKVISLDTQTSGAGAIDSGTATTSIVDTNCGSGTTPCDQINVTATVNQSFTFTLSSNSAALGTLSTSSPSAATAINASVSTNAKSGWQMWAADPAGTPGLHTTTGNYTVGYSPSAGSGAATLSNGTEGYNLGAGSTSGTCNGTTTINTNFASGGVSYKGGGLDNTLRTLADSTSTANACAVPLTVNASISATTPAATDYAGTVTVVAAGMF